MNQPHTNHDTPEISREPTGSGAPRTNRRANAVRYLANLAIGSSVVIGVGACTAFGDFASDDPGLREAPGQFAGRFLAVSDADMAATAYADGKLEPLAHARDEITLLADGRVAAAAPAPNSVVSWPQIIEVSADGRYAFVVETRGAPPQGADAHRVEDLPPGSRLSIFAIESGGLRLVESRDDLGQNPGSIAYVQKRNLLLITTESHGAELVAVALDANGSTRSVRPLPLAAPVREDDEVKRIRTIHVSPDGATFAANVANHRIQFYHLLFDAEGLPRAATQLGRPSVNLGRRLSVGKWTPDGRHFLVADTNGGGSAVRMLTQGPGAIIAIRPPEGPQDAPEVVSRASVGRFPEGFDINADGTRVAAINMERTYLPERAVLEVWPGRRRYSVSLLSLDPATGQLEELDRIHQAGVLPEDVIFDASGRNLAVAVFHRRKGSNRQRGFVDFFGIESDQLKSQGVTQRVMRGAHDLVRIP